jgi:hypothetical protein
MSSTSFLRRALVADAAISGATGVLMLAGAGLLEQWLGAPAALLRYAGLSLLPFAALVGGLARRERPSRTAVWAVIALNAAWVAGSVLLVVSGSFSLSALGIAFILVQALAVAAFAEMQYVGLRKAGA